MQRKQKPEAKSTKSFSFQKFSKPNFFSNQTLKNLYNSKIKENNGFDMLNSVNFDLQETPKKRSNSEIKPPYTETVPISKLLPYTKPKIEFGKCLSLDLYDPIIDPMGLDQLFESYKGRNSSVFGFSK